MASIADKKIMLNNLLSLRGSNGGSMGICTYAVKGVSDKSKVFTYLVYRFKEWEYYSGDIAFPVPTPINSKYYNKDARWAYYNVPKWTGKYGYLRKLLLDFLIEHIQKDLKTVEPKQKKRWWQWNS